MSTGIAPDLEPEPPKKLSGAVPDANHFLVFQAFQQVIAIFLRLAVIYKHYQHICAGINPSIQSVRRVQFNFGAIRTELITQSCDHLVVSRAGVHEKTRISHHNAPQLNLLIRRMVEWECRKSHIPLCWHRPNAHRCYGVAHHNVDSCWPIGLTVRPATSSAWTEGLWRQTPSSVFPPRFAWHVSSVRGAGHCSSARHAHRACIAETELRQCGLARARTRRAL